MHWKGFLVNKPELASFLLDLHKHATGSTHPYYYAAEGENENDLAAYDVQNMCCMLRLCNSLNIEAINHETVVWKKGNMRYDTEGEDHKMWRCAGKLHNDIFTMQIQQISEPVTANNMIKGEAIPSDSVKSYFKMLYTRKNSGTENLSSKKPLLVNSDTW